MIFTEPKPFKEALEARAVKTLLPTELRTKDLALLEPAIRERATFAAGVTNANFLQRVDDAIAKLLSGSSDRATQRMELKRLQGSLGDSSVDDTDLTDTRSDARLDLILDTNLQQAQGYGNWKQGQDAAVLEQWPAQELIRVQDSETPRDWSKRWADAGGQFFGTRMIALKNDPIWVKLSRFRLPYPPFDFNSGMDVQDVDRDTAVEVGLIGSDDVVEPQSRDFNQDLEASPDVRAAWLKEGVAESLQGLANFSGDGVLRFSGGAR